MYKRTMAPSGPDLGASNLPTSTGRVFLCEPVTFSSIFAVRCGLKCSWRAQFGAFFGKPIGEKSVRELFVWCAFSVFYDDCSS